MLASLLAKQTLSPLSRFRLAALRGAAVGASIFIAGTVAWGQSGQPANKYPGWKNIGALTILTTPDGANIPAGTSVEGFPVLVRLNKEWFDFKQAKPNGDDIRFATRTGAPLSYQIEEWDAVKGTASIWVRIPKIEGNARQVILVYSGKADAASESSGPGVFSASNGYLSVWHMNETVKDEVGALDSKDKGTTLTAGVVGSARHFAGGQGIVGGEQITNYPTAASPHTTELWYRSSASNMDMVCWGQEGNPRGKVRMQLRSPTSIVVDSDGGSTGTGVPMAKSEWIHVVHSYNGETGQIYINGQPDPASIVKTSMLILSPTRIWIGGWYNSYNFIGDIDEVRISKVGRSAEWVRLQYENQKPLQTLVGSVVQPGAAFAVSPATATVVEAKSAVFTAQAGGAQKVYWILKENGKETVVATDRFTYTFQAGRVSGDKSVTLVCKAVYPNEVKIKEIPIAVKEDIADPVFTLRVPAAWDGRTAIEVVPMLANMGAMQAKGAGELKIEWKVSGLAVIKEVVPTKEAVPGKLLLKRAQNSGKLSVTATISNGGQLITQTVLIAVTEPKTDPWIARVPAKDEKPLEGQFYARDDKNEGTLYYNGTLSEAGDTVFLKVYADDKPYKTETARVGADKSYTLSTKLKPGLVKYKVEFGVKVGPRETVSDTVNNLVCGDAYIIEGQSNGLATDTHEKSPPETSEWIRSYGRPSNNPKDTPGNLWCLPVWKAEHGEKAELGWWGMDLAKHLVESQKIPIFIINAAAGGTLIHQHQRNEADPTDLATIYGRMLWRVQQARMTHGIRGILWHQGENNQGANGPTGEADWKSYQNYFLEMSAAWKQDFPNIRNYYVFQIWPDACSMGGSSGGGDMIREIQRSLPRLYSNMSNMSTLGVKPPGSCHFPLLGWSEFARLIQPVIERDNYGRKVTTPITPPNLKRAAFSSAKDSVTLEFDQPIVWTDALTGQFYLDGEKEKVASGAVSGNVLTLKLKEASTATKITYLKERTWSQDKLVIGANGIAAFSFCDVPIELK